MEELAKRYGLSYNEIPIATDDEPDKIIQWDIDIDGHIISAPTLLLARRLARIYIYSLDKSNPFNGL